MVVLGLGKLVGTTGSVGIEGVCVGGRVDDVEATVWMDETKRGSTDKRSY